MEVMAAESAGMRRDDQRCAEMRSSACKEDCVWLLPWDVKSLFVFISHQPGAATKTRCRAAKGRQDAFQEMKDEYG